MKVQNGEIFFLYTCRYISVFWDHTEKHLIYTNTMYLSNSLHMLESIASIHGVSQRSPFGYRWLILLPKYISFIYQYEKKKVLLKNNFFEIVLVTISVCS